jgi:glycosyltransferase involved in cell wall biosynthesis
MKPLVSILIPAYNGERWLAEALESAVGQTWSRKEIIVVDDGSSDATLAVAKRYESRNVLVRSQSNQGAAAARNTALSLSQGDYIQWLDADDVLGIDKIALQMEALSDSTGGRVLLSSPWAPFMFRPGRARFRPTPLWADLTPADWLTRKMEFNLHMQTATWLVSRELTDATGPWNLNLLGDDDGEYFCRVLLQSESVRFVRDARVYYRVLGPEGLHHIGSSSAKMDAQFCSMRLHISYLRSFDDSVRVRKACVTYLQNWLLEFYPERPDIVEQAKSLAEHLGGRLERPRFAKKYAWIDRIGGPRIAKRVQHNARRLRWLICRSWDRTLLRLEGSRTHPINMQHATLGGGGNVPRG